MTTMSRYPTALDATEWHVPQSYDTTFRWEYEDGREKLLDLYAKGKRLQWDAAERIDWTQNLDPENPQGLPDEIIPIYGSDVWEKLTAAERERVRYHFQAWQLSQFLHGEQGALVCTAKIVQQVPSMDAKFYAATQVIDEARHVEAYSRLLHEKFQLVYPINPHLQQLLGDTLADSRWDFTYLGMQVLVEGVALAAFGLIRDQAKNPLARVGDRLRHAGRGAPRRLRPPGAARLLSRSSPRRSATSARSSWSRVATCCATASSATRSGRRSGCRSRTARRYVDRVGDDADLPHAACSRRIVPTIKDIGLWGPRIQKAYADMGILGFADGDVEALGAHDEAVAVEIRSAPRRDRSESRRVGTEAARDAVSSPRAVGRQRSRGRSATQAAQDEGPRARDRRRARVDPLLHPRRPPAASPSARAATSPGTTSRSSSASG